MKLPPSHSARRSAYILMEVMLATAIFAIAGVSLAIVLNGSISAAARTERESRIVWDLQSRLNTARINSPLPVGTVTDKPDANGVVYEQQITVLDLKNEHDQPLTGLYDIRVTAHWKEENQAMDMTAQTYVYRP